MQEQKVVRTTFACDKCKKHIEEDYYYCEADNEVYHADCADHDASEASPSMARAKGTEGVDE